MQIPSVSLKVASIKLGCKAKHVLETLAEKPQLMEQAFGCPSDGQLVIRDGLKRILVEGDGTVSNESMLEPPEPRQPILRDGVQVITEKKPEQALMDKLKRSAQAHEEFLRIFPEMKKHLDKFVRATGCGACRAPVIALLQSDDIRVEGFIKYLENLDA